MIVAARTLKLQQEAKDIDVDVRIFSPRIDCDSWSCRYEIDWPDGSRQGLAHGFDSVQALLSAMKMIGAELYTSDYHKSGALRWTELRQGYGFPVSGNLRDFWREMTPSICDTGL